MTEITVKFYFHRVGVVGDNYYAQPHWALCLYDLDSAWATHAEEILREIIEEVGGKSYNTIVGRIGFCIQNIYGMLDEKDV